MRSFVIGFITILIILTSGCELAEKKESSDSVYVSKGPVFRGRVFSGGGECTYSGKIGYFSCALRGELGYYSNSDGTTTYCLNASCSSQKELTGLSTTTPILRAPEGSNKIDFITDAIVELQELYPNLDTIDYINLLNEILGDASRVIPADYLESTLNSFNNDDLAVINFLINDLVYAFTSAIEGGSSENEAIEAAQTLYDSLVATYGITSSTNVEEIESDFTTKLQNTKILRKSTSLSGGELTFTAIDDSDYDTSSSGSLQGSSSSITITQGSVSSITFSNVSGTLTATPGNSNVAIANIVSNNRVSIYGAGAGSTTVVVSDSGGGSLTISVTVTTSSSSQDDTLWANSSSVSLVVGNNTDVTLSNISGTLSASSSNTSIATVSASSSSVNIVGVSAGSATITVSDDNASVTISVTVSTSSSGGTSGGSFTIATTGTPKIQESPGNLKASLSGNNLVLDFSDYTFLAPDSNTESQKIANIFQAKWGYSTSTMTNNVTPSGYGTTVTIVAYDSTKVTYINVITDLQSTTLSITYNGD